VLTEVELSLRGWWETSCKYGYKPCKFWRHRVTVVIILGLMENHGAMILTGITPDLATKALWQSSR
jgi:hypothetical protein